MREYDGKIYVTGRKNSGTGIIYVFDKNCNLLDKIEHPIDCGNNEGICSLLKVNKSSYIFPQLCFEKEKYRIRIYMLNIKKEKFTLLKKFNNIVLNIPYGNSYHFLNSSNFFTAGGTHYPSYNISLLAFRENLSLAYLRTYPFKGTLRHGDLGWREGTVIYAGDNGFTAYLFNATNGELIAAYNSSLPHRAYALDVKRDFIPGCYVLLGTEQISEKDWQVRLERICESENLKPVAGFAYKVQGLKVIFNSTSFDPDGRIAKYFWDFGDGRYSFVKNPAHIFPGEGSYTVILVVEDEKGLQSTARKTIMVKSIFRRINFKRFLLQNESLKVEILLDTPGKVRMSFANFSAVKEGKLIFHTFPANLSEGVYLLNISAGSENLSFRVRVFNETEFRAFLRLMNLKHRAQVKSYEISEKLGDLTLDVASHYAIAFAGDKISEFREKLREKIGKEIKGKIEKFAKAVKRYSKSMGERLEEGADEYSETLASNILEKLEELGKILGKKAIAQAVYATVFKPEIEKFEISEELAEENAKEMEEKATEANALLQNLEEIPVYNFSFLLFEAAPSVSYFFEKTQKSLETPEAPPPWDLFDLAVADAQSLLTIPVALGFFNETQRGKFRIEALPAAAIIAGIKAYIAISETVTKVSPGILLFGSYSSSYIASRDIIPEILQYAGFEIKSSEAKADAISLFLLRERFGRGERIEIKLNGSSEGENNIYLAVSQGSKTSFIAFESASGDFERKFNFSLSEKGSYLVKACIFSGKRKIACDIAGLYVEEETPVAGIKVNSSGMFAKNLYSKRTNITVLCGEKALVLAVDGGEEVRLNCTGETELYINDTMWDKEGAEVFEGRKNFCQFPFFVNENSVRINCSLDTKCRAFVFTPSGRKVEIASSPLALEEEGAYFVEIYCKNRVFDQGCFVSKKRGRLFVSFENGTVRVENEYGMPVKNVKIAGGSVEVFTDEGGRAFVGNATRVRIFSPCHEEKFVVLKEKKSVVLPKNVEIAESQGIAWINVSRRNASAERVYEIYDIAFGNTSADSYVLLKFSGLPKNSFFADKEFSFLGKCCRLNLSRNLTVFVVVNKTESVKEEAKIGFEKCSPPFVYLFLTNAGRERSVKICEIIRRENFGYCKKIFLGKNETRKERFLVLDKDAEIAVNGKVLASLSNCSFGNRFSFKRFGGKFFAETLSPLMKISLALTGSGLSVNVSTSRYEYSLSEREGRAKETFASPECRYEKTLFCGKIREMKNGECANLSTAREIAKEFLRVFT